MSAEQQLAILPAKEVALAVFSAPNGLDPYLQSVREEIDKFNASAPDVKTKKGQDAYRSIAYNLAGSKTKLDSLGKELVAELKDVPKKIDAERKRVRELLSAWQEEVRKPLTDWEAAEDARVAQHQAVIKHIENTDTAGMSAALIGAKIQDLDSCEINQELEEFEAEAHRAKAASLIILRQAMQDQEKLEAEQAELIKLRAEKEAQDQKDRETRIAQEAAEKARIESEQKAQRERDAEVKRAADEKAAAEKRENDLRLAVAESERKAEQARREKIESDQRAERERKEAAERQEKAVEEARIAEQKRADAAAAEIVRQQEARAADTAHKSKIMGEAKVAIMSMNVTEELAKALVMKIYRGEVPNITINF